MGSGWWQVAIYVHVRLMSSIVLTSDSELIYDILIEQINNRNQKNKVQDSSWLDSI